MTTARTAAPATIARAAVQGLTAGMGAVLALGCGGSTDVKKDDAAPGASAPGAAAAPAVSVADQNADKDCCAGKNECKGKGGCRTDKNDCSGKNECKGKGGCPMRCK